MRGMIAGLPSPHPLGASLPALYQEDAFAQRLTGALDEVLAPIFSSLDTLHAYLDPALAPDDFLEWLAGWVGVTLDETWPIERRRQLVADATQLYRSRGTVAGRGAPGRRAVVLDLDLAAGVDRNLGGQAGDRPAGAIQLGRISDQLAPPADAFAAAAAASGA